MQRMRQKQEASKVTERQSKVLISTIIIIERRQHQLQRFMFREQHYNFPATQPRQPVLFSAQRKLQRQIHNNQPLSHSRSSQGSSLRMRRTQLSNQRFNSSKDQHTQNVSGMLSVQISDQRVHLNKKVGSILSLSRRKLPANNHTRSGKNIVENIYMLSNEELQYQQKLSPHQENGRQRSNKYQIQPQSPRPYPQNRSRKENSNGRSILRRQSRDKSSQRQKSSSRGRHYRVDKPQNMRQLQEKYLQNAYRIKSPTTRYDRGYQNNRRDQQRYQQQEHRASREHRSPRAYKAQQDHRDQRDHRRYKDQNDQRGYRDSKERRRDNRYNYDHQRYAYDRREEQRWQIQQRQYQAEREGYNQGKRMPDRTNGYYRNDMNKYYFQGPSTTGSRSPRTLPQTSRVDTISQGSFPASFASQKQMQEGSTSPRNMKRSVKLDRPKEKNKKASKAQLMYEPSDLQQRWKQNNIKFQEHQQQLLNKKHKIMGEFAYEGLPVGVSTFLPVQSKRLQINQWAQDIMQKVILHLETLNLIADYTKEFKKMYESVQPWQVLIFLTYKKFYVERTKAINSLRQIAKGSSIQKNQLLQYNNQFKTNQNPFILPYSKLSDEQLKRFRQTKECMAMVYELESENSRILTALRALYNLYIEKSGDNVNMLDCDDFSDQIYKLMKEEIEAISELLTQKDLLETTKLRMGKIIKAGLLIAYLNGKYVKNFAQLLLQQDTVRVGKKEQLRQDCICDVFKNQFRRVLS